MTKIERVPGTEYGGRFTFLVLIPTGSSFAVWVVISADGMSVVTRLWIAAFLPLFGLLAVLAALAYRSFTQQPEPLWPFVPFGIAAVAFTISAVDLAETLALGPDSSLMPIPYVAGFLAPWLALVGGLVSFVLGLADQR